MNIYPSLELRWFTPGSISQVEYWFSEYSAKLKGKWDRTDQYLKTGSPEFSIKLREGRLEFKLRGEPLETPVTFLPGKAYFWKKWSYGLHPAPPDGLFNDASDIIEIKKERVLRYTSTDRNEVTDFLPAGSYGCQVEYSRISIEGNIFYSFGLESFGPDTTIMIRELHHAAEVLMNELPDLAVRDLYNVDYPEKLAAL